MNRSTPGLPVHHQLSEPIQTHVHWVDDAVQPSHPLSSPSPPAHNLSPHQSLFKWASSLHQVAKVLEFQPQHQSFQWTPRTSKASILLHSAFFIVQLSHPYMTTGKTIALTRRTFVDKVMSLLFNILWPGLNRRIQGISGGRLGSETVWCFYGNPSCQAPLSWQDDDFYHLEDAWVQQWHWMADRSNSAEN